MAPSTGGQCQWTRRGHARGSQPGAVPQGDGDLHTRIQSGTEQPGAETNHRPLAGGMDGTGGDGEKVKGITSMDFTGKVAEFCKFQK